MREPQPGTVPPVRVTRPRPSREVVLQARRARRRRHLLFTMSLILAAIGGALRAWLEQQGALSMAWRWTITVAALLPGVGCGVAAGPRIWPAYFPVILIAMSVITALVPWPGFALTYTAVGVVVFGYGLRGAWSVATQGVFWVPLRREPDAPRGGGGVRSDGAGPGGTTKATVASSRAPEKVFRMRPFW